MKRLLFILALFITFNLSAQHGVTTVLNSIQAKFMCSVLTFSDSGIVIQIDTANKWFQVTNINKDAFSYFVETYGVSCANDTMYLEIGGLYIFLCNWSIIGNNQAIDWDFGIMVDNIVLTPRPHRSTNATGQSGNVSAFTIYQAADSAKVIMLIKNLSGTQNPIIESATIVAIRVGDFGSSGLCALPLFLIIAFIKRKELI